MTWTVIHDAVHNIIEVNYTGVVSGAELNAAASKRIALHETTGATRVLVDVTEIELSASLFDVFALPAKLYDKIRPPRNSRMALVLPRLTQYHEAALFYRDACLNRGWVVETFATREEAIAWLTDQAEASR